MAKLWVVYDDRAMSMSTDDCSVIEACSSYNKAMEQALPGIVYEYDIITGDQLINETLIGPNRAFRENND